MKKLLLITAVLSLAVLACSIDFGDPTPVPQAVTPTENSGAIETAVALTLTAQQPAATSTPDQQVPTDTPEPQLPTDAPTEAPPLCLPAFPGAHPLLPASEVAVTRYEYEGVDLVNFSGTLTHTFLAPGFSDSTGQMMHIAGGTSLGYVGMPLYYHVYANMGEIHQNISNINTVVGPAPMFVTMAGLQSSDYFAFSNSGTGADGWTSDLFVGSSGTITGSASALHRYEGDGNVIYPLAIHDSGAGYGVIYTESLYGIGNIYFPPFSGLFYFDTVTNTVVEFLPNTENLLGISPDHTHIAYASDYGTGTEFYVKNLLTCEVHTFSFLPGTSRGAGYVNFSTDNSRLAWVELSGPDLMNVTPTMRTALMDGTILSEGTAASYAGLNGGTVPTWIRPWAWKDDHVLVVGVNNDGLTQTLVLWAPDPAAPLDPAMGANQSAPFANGVFLGFVYP